MQVPIRAGAWQPVCDQATEAADESPGSPTKCSRSVAAEVKDKAWDRAHRPKARKLALHPGN